MRSPSLMTRAVRSIGSASRTPRPDLRRLIARLRRWGVTEVSIERPDGPVVDALLEAELTVFVIDPKQIKNLRGRYGSAGNKDDRFDAYVLADVLRTDRARMRPLTRDSEQTITLRMTVRARQDLVHARVAMANQLRAHLQTTLPGAIGLFRDIDSAITLRFLTRFPSQDKADWLSRIRLGNWLRSIGYNHQANLDRLWAHLHDAPRGTTGPQAAARAEITLALVAAPEQPAHPDQSPRAADRRPARRPSRRRDLHLAAPSPAPSAPPGSSPRSATPAAGSPPPRHSPAWPAPPRRRNSPERSKSSPSGGRSTSNYAAPSSTSPATPTTPTPGPPTCTPRPSRAATTTPTPHASSPEPGSTSSGDAGKTASPTTPPNTTPYNASNTRRLDTGLLMPAGSGRQRNASASAGLSDQRCNWFLA